jgi:outer membrane protein OmpA-like peptidoglycan-associated protein
MKKKSTFALLALFFLVLILNNQSYSQFKDYSFKLGLQGNYVMPGTEWTPDGVSLLFRPNITFQLSKMFNLGIGVGYGWLSSKDYLGTKTKTSFIPADLRLIFAPFQAKAKAVNPYIYLGAGGAYWSLDTKPNPKIPGLLNKDNGITGLGEAGLGLEIALSKKWVLDLSGGFNVFATDDVNGIASNLNDKFLHDYDRYINIGLGLSYVKEGCTADDDKDGLTNCEEELLGLDPNNPDTDGDGLTDGDEVLKYKTNPLKADSDGDGLSDGDEVLKYKTDPNKADTDGDGLSDGDEVMKYKTDPLVADTDKDGLNDSDEVLKYKTDPINADTDKDGLKDGEEILKYKTDPLKADTDGDGLSDGQEVNTYHTDPLKADTDGDGLTDGQEVNTYHTDPLVADTDKDGLNDGEEVNTYHTDPLKADTDGGGVTDGREVKEAPITNPLDANDDWMHGGGVSLRLTVQFAKGKSVIQPQYIPELQNLLPKVKQFLKSTPTAKIIIDGFTSSDGATKTNLKLSQSRANAVRAWFVSNGVASDKISSLGHGEDPQYLIKNPDGTENMEASRRITLRVK